MHMTYQEMTMVERNTVRNQKMNKQELIGLAEKNHEKIVNLSSRLSASSKNINSLNVRFRHERRARIDSINRFASILGIDPVDTTIKGEDLDVLESNVMTSLEQLLTQSD
ncbi:hypothetical protein ACQR3P_29025 [Rhodococcus sp. IEGM1300]